jgi:hypothetical protein
MAEHFLKEFEQYVSTTPAQLASFWQCFFKTRYGSRFRDSHPSLRLLDIDDLAHVVPLALHGDAAPYSKKRSALFIQWGALLGIVTHVRGTSVL